MIKRFFQMFWLSIRLSKVIPFRIYMPARIRLMPGARINQASRVILGSNKKQLPVSANKICVSVGRQSTLDIGLGVSLGPGVKWVVKDGATMSIGDHTYFTADAHIEAAHQITIGKQCAVSWGTTIIDDNHHQVIYKERKTDQTKNAVIIGDHVWIGCDVTILAGTKIGENSIVAAGSVVKGNFPANVLIAGNPARVIKEGVEWK